MVFWSSDVASCRLPVWPKSNPRLNDIFASVGASSCDFLSEIRASLRYFVWANIV